MFRLRGWFDWLLLGAWVVLVVVGSVIHAMTVDVTVPVGYSIGQWAWGLSSFPLLVLLLHRTRGR